MRIYSKYVHRLQNYYTLQGQEDPASGHTERSQTGREPLSPLLFNLIIDPIIGTLDETTEGVKLENENISVLAFADDLVLLAKNKEIAEKQNRLLNNYLKDLKMKVSAEKCTTFEIKHQNKTWFLKNPQHTFNPYPVCRPRKSNKIGINFNPWKALCKASIKEIVDAAKSVKQLKLKPHQKINLIKTYLLPKNIYKSMANPPLGTLDQIDNKLRIIIKEILHLHLSITDGIIYGKEPRGSRDPVGGKHREASQIKEQCTNDEVRG